MGDGDDDGDGYGQVEEEDRVPEDGEAGQDCGGEAGG